MPRNRILLFALSFGLALRLAAAYRAIGVPLVMDEVSYASIATNIVTRGAFIDQFGETTAMRTPMYPGFLALFVRLCPGTWTCARIGQSFLDTTSILLVYIVGLWALRREREASVGALFYALHPVFVAHSTHILSEVFFFWIWLMTAWLLLRTLDPDSDPGAAGVVSAGVALGLTVLSRPNFMYFPPGIAAAVWLFHDRRAAALRRLLVIIAICYATVFPWVFRNHRVMNRWIVAAGGGNNVWAGAQLGTADAVALEWKKRYDDLNLTHNELEVEDEFYRLAKIDWKKNWPGVIKDLPRRFLVFWLTSHSALFGIDQSISVYRAQGRWLPILVRAGLWALHLGILLCGFAGLWLMRRSWTLGCTFALASFGYYCLHILVAYWTNRYHLPALAVWLVFAAVPVVRGFDHVAKWAIPQQPHVRA